MCSFSKESGKALPSTALCPTSCMPASPALVGSSSFAWEQFTKSKSISWPINFHSKMVTAESHREKKKLTTLFYNLDFLLYCLDQGQQTFTTSDGKYFRLCRPKGLHHKDNFAIREWEQTQTICTKREWLGFSKTLRALLGEASDLAWSLCTFAWCLRW